MIVRATEGGGHSIHLLAPDAGGVGDRSYQIGYSASGSPNKSADNPYNPVGGVMWFIYIDNSDLDEIEALKESLWIINSKTRSLPTYEHQ